VEKRNKPCRDAAIHPAGVISSREAYPHQTHLSVARILWQRSARGAGRGGGILDSPRVFLGKLLRFAQQTPLGYERVPSSVVLSCFSLALPFTLSPFSLAERDVRRRLVDELIVNGVPRVRRPEVRRRAITPARCHAVIPLKLPAEAPSFDASFRALLVPDWSQVRLDGHRATLRPHFPSSGDVRHHSPLLMLSPSLLLHHLAPPSAAVAPRSCRHPSAVRALFSRHPPSSSCLPSSAIGPLVRARA